MLAEWPLGSLGYKRQVDNRLKRGDPTTTAILGMARTEVIADRIRGGHDH